MGVLSDFLFLGEKIENLTSGAQLKATQPGCLIYCPRGNNVAMHNFFWDTLYLDYHLFFEEVLEYYLNMNMNMKKKLFGLLSFLQGSIGICI